MSGNLTTPKCPTSYTTEIIDKRCLILPMGITNYNLSLDNYKRHIVLFEVDPEVVEQTHVSSIVILQPKIGRVLLDPRVSLSPRAYTQIDNAGYSFLRFSSSAPFSIVLPIQIDKIGLEISTNDKGLTWLVERVIFFDENAI